MALHYTDEGGRPRKLRASPEHLVYLAPAGLAASRQPLDQLPPGGAAARADKVRPGDALAVASEREAGSFFVARVTDVTRCALGRESRCGVPAPPRAWLLHAADEPEPAQQPEPAQPQPACPAAGCQTDDSWTVREPEPAHPHTPAAARTPTH